MIRLDGDFIKMQQYAHKLFDSLPVIKQEALKNDKDLINQLQYLCVCYGRKLVSLFDKYQILQKRNQEHQSQTLVNLATVLNVQPNESAILEQIQKLFKSQEQSLQKIEYLNIQLSSIKSAQPDAVYQKMLTHEQNLTQELQTVVDKLVKELKQSKDDKQILLNELQEREEQLKQLMSPTKGSAKKYYNSNSDQKRGFCQQLYLTFQSLQDQVKQLLNEYIKKTETQIELEINDDQQLLCLNISNSLRDLTQILQIKEEQISIFIQQMQTEYEYQLNQQKKQQIQDIDLAEKKLKGMQQLENEHQKLLNQYQQVQHNLNKAKEKRQKEIENIIKNDENIFIMPDILMDSETQLIIEKHNQKLTNSQAQQSRKNEAYTSLKIACDQGLSRLNVLLQELGRMADSQEAQKLIKFCEDELLNLLNTLQYEQNNVELEMKQQKQTWLSQIDVLRKYFQEQVDGLLYQVDEVGDQMKKFQEISEGLHNDNDQLVKKLKNSQQELMQLKNALVQENETSSEKEKQIKQNLDTIQHLEQLNKKQQQHLEQLNNELIQQRKEMSSGKKLQQQEHQEEIQQFKDQLQILEFENKTYKKQIQTIEEEFTKLKQQRLQQESNSENEKSNLRKNLEEKKRQIQQLHQENRKQNQEALNQIEQLQNELNQISNQIEEKTEENVHLNSTLIQLEEFSRKQLEVIRNYEEKLSEAIATKRNLEFSNQDHDMQMQQLQSKISQLQQQNTQYRHENEKLLTDLSILQKNSQKQLEQTVDDFRDKSSKQQEINRILKEEAKNLKAQLDLKLNQLRQAEQELSDKNQELEKAQKVCKQLNQQIQEFKQQIENLDGQESLQQKNYSLQMEIQNLKSQLMKVQKPDQNLQQEILNLKSELRKMEMLINQDKSEKLNKLDKQDQYYNSPQQFDSANRQKSAQSGSAFYENLIEAKDLEIARLAGIVKSLTNLRK